MNKQIYNIIVNRFFVVFLHLKFSSEESIERILSRWKPPEENLVDWACGIIEDINMDNNWVYGFCYSSFYENEDE